MSNKTETQADSLDSFRVESGHPDSDVVDLATEDGIVTPAYVEDSGQTDSPLAEVREYFAVASDADIAMAQFLDDHDGHGSEKLYNSSVELRHRRDDARKGLSSLDDNLDKVEQQGLSLIDRFSSRILGRKKEQHAEEAVVETSIPQGVEVSIEE